MKKAVSVLLAIVLAAVLITVTAGIAGALAVCGSNAAGMSAVPSYSLLPLAYLIYGGLAGAVLFLPVAAGCYFLVGKKRGAHPSWSMLVSALILWLSAYPVGFAFYQGGLVLQEREREKSRLSTEREREANRIQNENDRNTEASDRPWIVTGE